MEEKPNETVKGKVLKYQVTKKMMIAVGVLIVAMLAMVLVVALFLRFHSAQSPDVPSILSSLDGHRKEVDVESLAGVHVGRMVARGNNTEGLQMVSINYRMQCEDLVQLNESVLRCDFAQIGCAMAMQNDVTEEECIMDEIHFSFEVDEDGKIFTNESEVPDPARLALALYSKHYSARDYTGNIQQVAVNKTNSTHARMTLDGMSLEVTELSADAFADAKPRQSKKSDQANAFLKNHTQPHGTRRRRSAQDSILDGEFARSLKKVWKGGPFIKIRDVLSKSGSQWPVKYDFSLTDLEILLSTLPDIQLTAIVPPINSAFQDGYKVKLRIDFSLDQQCSDVVASRVHVKFHARACVWFWCFINVRKDDRVSLSFSPDLELTLTLKPQGADLHYSMELTQLHMAGFNSDIGGVDVSINIGRTIGGVLFGPAGFLVGFLVDSIMENIAEGIYRDLERYVPSEVNDMATSAIRGLLPAPGVLNEAGAALVAAHIISGVYDATTIPLLTLELSQIGSLLADAPPPFQPNKIPCSGQGLIERIPDGCMDDYGASASGDSLEIYCYSGAKRFCLSGELCPWRKQRSSACSALFELATCSVGGLRGKDMANTWGNNYGCTRHCSGWWLWRRCWNNCGCSGSSYGDVECDEGSVQI